MRVNSEGDIARLREQLADAMATSAKEVENLRRALDDMKYQNEESIRQINIKNEEIESMMDQMDNLGKIIEKKEWDIADHKASICHLEMKNRKLNETVNKAIYGKTQGNIDKTMDVLTRRGTDPAIVAKQQSMGINPTSHGRLKELMKGDSTTFDGAMQELEQKRRQEEMLNEAANSRSALNDPSRSAAQVVE
jgi:chromosome segregation ATPase